MCLICIYDTIEYSRPDCNPHDVYNNLDLKKFRSRRNSDTISEFAFKDTLGRERDPIPVAPFNVVKRILMEVGGDFTSWLDRYQQVHFSLHPGMWREPCRWKIPEFGEFTQNAWILNFEGIYPEEVYWTSENTRVSLLCTPAHPGDAQTAGLVSTRPLPPSLGVILMMPVKNSFVWRVQAKCLNSKFWRNSSRWSLLDVRNTCVPFLCAPTHPDDAPRCPEQRFTCHYGHSKNPTRLCSCTTFVDLLMITISFYFFGSCVDFAG